MHLCGTHCVRSGGKTQINRAQSRWNKGRADARDGAEECERNRTEAESGRVHATKADRTAEKSFSVARGAVEGGSDCGDEAVSVTQQQSAIRMEQHEDFV